jgi:hypothetical protein
VEVMIKFESRLHRDKFIAYLRSIKVIRVIVLSKLFEHFNDVINMEVSSYSNPEKINELHED